MSAPLPLSGKSAVVTGGNGGIGRGLCAELLALGASVASLDRTPRAWPDALAAVRPITVDLTDPAAVDDAFAALGAPVDILINNAGFYSVERRPFWDIDPAEWELVVRANLTPAFLCARAASAGMRARRTGRIVNLSSSTASAGMPNLMHYIAAKAAIVGMTRAMASELGSYGVTVNAVAPGLVATPVATADIPAAAFAQAVSSQRIQQPIPVAAIVSAVTYLCLPGASLITGQTLLVNGGADYGGF